MVKKGECMYCKLQKPLFLHHVYHKNDCLHVCTTCLLNMYPGAFCPVCFQVYETKDFNPSSDRVICSCCPAMSHLSCVASTIASTSTSTSTSDLRFRYICPSCSDPTFKFFNLCRDEKATTVLIDKHLARQLLAASEISRHSMREAAISSRRQAEIKAKEAVQAQKKAKLAIERLVELTSSVNRLDSVDIPNESIPSSSQCRETKKRRLGKKRLRLH